MLKYLILLLLAAGMTVEALGFIFFMVHAVITWDPNNLFFLGGLAAHIGLVSLCLGGFGLAGHMANEFIDELKD